MQNKSFFENVVIPQQAENDSPENKALEMLIEGIYNTEDVDIKTDLNNEQIIAMTRAQMYADLFQVPVLNVVVKKMMRMLISLDRKGRKEYTDIATKTYGGSSGESSTFDRLIGRNM